MKKAESIFRIIMFLCISVASIVVAINSVEDTETKLLKKELLEWQITSYKWDNEAYIRALNINE